MRSARIICCIVLGLQTSALLTPSRPPRAALRCDAKSKKKAKAEFKPPPPELSRPIDVFSRRDSHAVSTEAAERAAIALRIGVEELRSLEASVAVERSGRGGDVTLRGELTATVAQKSVTSGDLIVSDVTAPIDFWVVVAEGDHPSRLVDGHEAADAPQLPHLLHLGQVEGPLGIGEHRIALEGQRAGRVVGHGRGQKAKPRWKVHCS